MARKTHYLEIHDFHPGGSGPLCRTPMEKVSWTRVTMAVTCGRCRNLLAKTDAEMRTVVDLESRVVELEKQVGILKRAMTIPHQHDWQPAPIYGPIKRDQPFDASEFIKNMKTGIDNSARPC